MNTEAKKLQIIEEVLKIKSDVALTEIDALIKKAIRSESSKKVSAHNFSGIISEDDVMSMEAAIEAGCEQIHLDDWK
jgi:hypothetical protein